MTCYKFAVHLAGEIFLVYMPEKIFGNTINNLEIRVYTDKTTMNKTALLRELATVGPDGVAYDDQGFYPDIRSLAAPIRDENGYVMAT